MWESVAVAVIANAQLKKESETAKLLKQELDLRENSPGVKAAWEQYQIMLKLSRK